VKPKKLREGCWRIDFRDHMGRRFRFNFPTYKAADDKLAELKVSIKKGEFVAPKAIPSFAAVAQEWLSDKSDRRPGTVVNWRAQINRHLLPAFGPLRLDRINVATVEKLQGELREAGLSASTIGAVRTTLSAIFNLASRRGYVATKNPVGDAARPFAADKEITINESEDGRAREAAVSEADVLSPAEIRRLLAAAGTGLYRVLFTTASLTGLRSGELFGLRWSDLELDREDGRGRLFVSRTLTWARMQGEEGAIRPKLYPPKTKAGKRDLPIPTELVSSLKAWKLQCPPSELDLVFCTLEGKPIRRSNALRYGLWPALRRAGLRRVNMHSLRHSFASALIMNGAPVTEVQAKLGHSSPKVTLDVYAHWFDDVETDSVDRLAKAIMAPPVRKRLRHGTKRQAPTTKSPQPRFGHFLDTSEVVPGVNTA
jgi:integrase